MAYQDQTSADAPGRGDNAKRYGKMGLLVGAILGLVQGGGLAGMVQMGVLAGSIGAASGAVAGNKLNPIMDKALSLIPGFKNRQATKSQEAAMDMPLGQSQGPVFREVEGAAPSLQQQAAAPQVAQENFRALDSIDADSLSAMREQASGSLRSAGEGMEPGTAPMSASRLPDEWISRNGGNKQPTHEGPAMRQ